MRSLTNPPSAALGLVLITSFNLISIALFVLFDGLGVAFAIQFSLRCRAERYEHPDLYEALRWADPLSEMILTGDVAEGDAVVISADGNVLTFNGKPPQTAEVAQFEAAQASASCIKGMRSC